MKAQGSHVILFSIASSAEEEGLVRQLADIGIPHTIKADNLEQLGKLVGEGSYSALVFLLTDAAYSQKALLEIKDLAKTLPMIGLFSKDCTFYGQPVVDACHEIASWPCSDLELNYRIGKFTKYCRYNRELDNDFFVKMNIVGNSLEFQQMLHKVARIITCDAPVFIDGETGTGKELIARAIHYLGERKDQPFIAANCGAFPDQLVENELFGHHKGAYTDAHEASEGIVAQAEGGTLFLDEIENLSPKGQVTLLRFLEDMTYRPLGGKTTRKANIRVITATNESISELVAGGGFRKDLYYRVNIMNILLPPLRERGADINLLAEHFIRRYQVQFNQPEKELHPNSRDALKFHDWPGNVRELENMLHREFLLADGKYVTLGEIESMTRERRNSLGDRRVGNMFDQPLVKAKNSLIKNFEKQYLCSALDRANGNISRAARLAGKERRSFTRLLEKHELAGLRAKTH